MYWVRFYLAFMKVQFLRNFCDHVRNSARKVLCIRSTIKILLVYILLNMVMCTYNRAWNKFLGGKKSNDTQKVKQAWLEKNIENVPNSGWPGNHTAHDEASLLFTKIWKRRKKIPKVQVATTIRETLSSSEISLRSNYYPVHVIVSDFFTNHFNYRR